MGQQIGKSRNSFPLRGSAGEATVESRIDYEILVDRIGNAPERADGIAADERLGKVPQLTGDSDLSERMRDGNRLSKLGAAGA